ncbi:MAG: excisionase family DNA-binding protein [Sporichthyaceae bacterium]
MSTYRRPARQPIPAQAGSSRDLLVEQAAERLGKPVRFVRRLIAERPVRFYKVGRYVRFAVEDLDEFVAADCIEPFDSARR